MKNKMTLLLITILIIAYSQIKAQETPEFIYPPTGVVINDIPGVKFTSRTGSITLIALKDFQNEKALVFPIVRRKSFSMNGGLLYVTPTLIYFDNKDNASASAKILKSDIKKSKPDNTWNGVHYYSIDTKNKDYQFLIVYEPVPPSRTGLMGAHQKPAFDFLDKAIKDFDGAMKTFLELTKDAVENRDKVKKEDLAKRLNQILTEQELEQRYLEVIKTGEKEISDLSAQKIELIRTAIKALRKMSGATEIGVAFQEYSSRLIDCKADVDEAMTVLPKSVLRDEIQLSLDAFVDANLSWNEMIRYDFMLADTEFSKSLITRYGLTPDSSSATGSKLLPKNYVLSSLWAYAKKHTDRASEVLQKSIDK